VTSTPAGDPGLPPEQLEEIFQQIIVPDYLLRSNPQPQQHPQGILLGGNPAPASPPPHPNSTANSPAAVVWSGSPGGYFRSLVTVTPRRVRLARLT
jgi:hypothetical protein